MRSSATKKPPNFWSELEESSAAIRAILHDQVHAQFTSIAAHAEIARDAVALARGEARADLERTRETLIGLMEQVRDRVCRVRSRRCRVGAGAVDGRI